MKMERRQREESHLLATSWFFGLFVLTAFSSCTTALTRPFWTDEVFTAAVVRLGSVWKIWNALQKGADQQPPVFYWITWFTSSPQHSEFWMRMPGIAGFSVLMLTLFFFMYRAKGAVAALVSVAVLMSSEGLYYASEARPYGALLGCLGLAAVLWQERKRGNDSSRNLVALVLALTAVCALHYFGLFAVMVFGLVEVFLGLRSRKLDSALLLSLPLTLIPLMFAKRLIHLAHSQYAGAFWAHPSLTTLAKAYKFTFFIRTLYFESLSRFRGTAIILGFLVPVSVLLAALGILFFRSRRQGLRVTPNLRVVPPEVLLGVGFLLLPLIVGAAAVVTGAFTPRYAIGSLIGAAVIFGWVIASVRDNLGYVVAATLTLIFVSHQSLQDIQRMAGFMHGTVPAVVARDGFEPIFRRAHSGESIVIPDGHLFFEATEYADAEIRSRLLYLQDHKLALQFAGTDSIETANDAIKPYFDLRLEQPAAFLSKHRDFIMASHNLTGWLPAYLVRAGAQIEMIEKNAQGVTVSRVHLPARAPSGYNQRYGTLLPQ